MRMILIMLLMFIIRPINGQELAVVYDAFVYEDEQDTPDNVDRVSRLSLTIKDGKSLYSRDSVFLRKPPSFGEERWNRRYIYKEYNDDLIITDDAYFKDGWVFKEKISDRINDQNYKWEDTGRSKLICGVRCNEVTAGVYKAWYAPDIPISDGPFTEIFNLPGLVLQYENGIGKWIAREIIFEAKDFTIPKNKISEVRSEIAHPKWYMLEFTPKEAIFINSSSPLNKWLKFEE